MSETDSRGAALRKLASRTSLCIAIILVAVKLQTWVAAGSVALLPSAVSQEAIW